MKRSSFKFPTFFPAYTPAHDHPPDVAAAVELAARHSTRWGKRILLLATVLGILGATLTQLGFHGPQTQKRLSAVEDSVRKFSVKIDSQASLSRENLRVSCAILFSLQPRAIVQPQSCQMVTIPPFQARR